MQTVRNLPYDRVEALLHDVVPYRVFFLSCFEYELSCRSRSFCLHFLLLDFQTLALSLLLDFESKLPDKALVVRWYTGTAHTHRARGNEVSKQAALEVSVCVCVCVCVCE